MRQHEFHLSSIVVNLGRLYIIISEYAFNCVILFRCLVKMLDKNRQNSINSNFLAHVNNVFTEGIH